MKKYVRYLLVGSFLLAIYILFHYLMEVTYFIDPFQQVNIYIAGINIIMAVSLNLIVGFTGQLALGHAGFMAVGAYISAVLTLMYNQPFIVAILVGGLVAMLLGILIGLPTLRLKGDYLAIATLGFGEIIRGTLVNIEYTGGAAGLNGIPQYTSWTWLFILVCLTIIIIANFINSTHGRACIAIRDDEIAAEAMGINTTYYKTFAFSLGAFFAGVAGALYAHYFYFIQPNTFSFLLSFEVLVMVVLGGLGSITGSVIAAILITGINALLIDLGALRTIIYAFLLVVIMIFRPHGLMGNKEFTLKTLFKGKKGGA